MPAVELYKNTDLWKNFVSKNRNVVNNNISSINTTKPDNIKQDNKTTFCGNKYLWGTLAGLAVIGVATLVYLKTRKPVPVRQPVSQNPVSSSDTSDILYSFKTTVSDFINRLSPKDKINFEQNLNNINLKQFECFDFLENKSADILPLEQFFAMQNAKIKNNIALPDVIEMNGINNENIANIGKVFFDKFNTDFARRKYIPGDTAEFLEALRNFTTKKSDNFTFMHIENFNEFLNDLKKTENKSLLETFKNLLSDNANKKLSYLTETIDDTSVPIKKFSLKFSDKVNGYDFFRDKLPFYNVKGKNILDLSKTIVSELENKMFLDKSDITSLLEREKSHITFSNAQNETIESFVSSYITRTGDNFTVFDCNNKSLKEIISELSKILPEREKFNGRTDKMSFLHLKNIEQIINETCDIKSEEYKTLKNLLKTANQKYKTVFITTENDNAGKFFKSIKTDDFSFLIKCKNAFFDEKLFTQMEADVKNRINQFSYNNEIMKNISSSVIEPIIKEKAGYNILSSPKPNDFLTGGIMLSGKTSSDNDIAQKALENALGNLIKTEKMGFDKNHMMLSVKKIIEKVKELEKEYATNKTRTLLEIENFDEMFLRANDSRIRLIQGRIKNFIEHLPEQYHTNILMKTTKRIEDLESSCIPSHRFRNIYTSLTT